MSVHNQYDYINIQRKQPPIYFLIFKDLICNMSMSIGRKMQLHSGGS